VSGTRNPGRYSLHRLGWSAFEDLSMQIMRVVLGETCSRFRPGADGGRDGWFQGVAAGGLTTQDGLAGSFLVQCKHTSETKSPLTIGDLKRELEKVRAFAAKTPVSYVLMTNRQITAQSEGLIRSAFEAVPAVTRCVVLAETWIEDTIDAHPRLLRLVPRLYGIGDLSQILSFVVEQQTIALFEDLAHSLRTFVPTDSYRRAERALHDHGFVVLVGPPASGKSAIAANLCMVNQAQDGAVRVMRIEHADQFKATWSPSDKNTIYWVDDVFGETTLDEPRLREWSAALEKVEGARQRGARIVFCTRDYILAAAEPRLKKNKADVINDARVRVNVTDLAIAEREMILYNHIKHGDISTAQKRGLKLHLAAIANLTSFSPELARRLGNQRFNKREKHDRKDLVDFFEQPVAHLRELIQGLSGRETAALAVCLLSGNAVPDPIPDDALATAVLSTYGVSVQQVREAFEQLEGSLVKRTREGTTQTWHFHHPSMIEALQEELSSKSSQLVLFIQSARLAAVLRDTTTLPVPQGSRVVFLSEVVYPHLIARVAAEKQNVEGVGAYLATRGSDSLLQAIEATAPATLDAVLSVVPEPEGPDVAASLAVRLWRIGLLTGSRRDLVVAALDESLDGTGCVGFLDVVGIDGPLLDFVHEFLRNESSNGFKSMSALHRWYAQDLSSSELVDSAQQALEAHSTRLQSTLSAAGLLSEDAQKELESCISYFYGALEERRGELEEQRGRREDYEYEQWKEERYERRAELDQGRFADVDE
jgi:energy-coupling factor transporter ATP-binding protein EcfA2